MSLWKYAYSLPLFGRLFPNRKRILKTMREAAERAAGKVRLTPFARQEAARVSGGQRQRVALARAIVDGREICLMDEPLSNLDAQLRASTRREIADLHRDLGHTIVYVTHDQTGGYDDGHAVILMREGRIEQDGAPAELYEQPATTYAAEFLGSPPDQFHACRERAVFQSRGAAVVTLGDGRCPLDPHGDLLIGVRPDHLEITPDAQGSSCFFRVSRRKDHCFPSSASPARRWSRPSARTGSTGRNVTASASRAGMHNVSIRKAEGGFVSRNMDIPQDSYDLVVVGGGTSGVFMTISAARRGCAWRSSRHPGCSAGR